VNARRRPRRGRRGELINELERDLRPVSPPNIFIFIWRWRWELAIFLGIPTGLALLASQLGWIWSVASTAMVAVAAAWPENRHWLIAHIRGIITAHRVRTGCGQAWIQTRSGKLPIILLTRPKPYGERVYIWCRAGICREDFEASRDILRCACWATDIYITSSTRYSHIVALDVIRNPLSN
jgi:hypothetical protein